MKIYVGAFGTVLYNTIKYYVTTVLMIQVCVGFFVVSYSIFYDYFHVHSSIIVNSTKLSSFLERLCDLKTNILLYCTDSTLPHH